MWRERTGWDAPHQLYRCWVIACNFEVVRWGDSLVGRLGFNGALLITDDIKMDFVRDVFHLYRFDLGITPAMYSFNLSVP